MIMRRSIVSRIPMIRTGLLLAISVLIASGCGMFSSTRRETKLLYKGVGGSSGTCQKVMAALPFENDVRWAETDLNAFFAQELKRAIERECSDVNPILPGSPGFPARFNEPVRRADGVLDSASLASAGQASGINLVLSGRLVGIRHVTEDRGMLWFAKVVHLARIQLEVAIYHTGTGAKVFDRNVFHDIEITETDGGLIDAREMPKNIPLDAALTEVAEAMGKAAHRVIKYIPWEGYVISVEGGRVVLSAGESCGLKKGRELKVYTVEKVEVDETGQHFFSPGPVAGRITVTAVHSDRTEAVIKDGGPILPGSVVRVK